MVRSTVPCVGAVVHDSGRILLVRRANPPCPGSWSLPGGRVEPGEDDATAVAREVAEETGLAVAPGRLVGTAHLDAPDGAVFVVRDYSCEVIGGTLVAGDDATAVGWFSAEDLETLPTVEGLRDILTEWDALPG
ncbi:MAG: NUDIX hydrolase [Actinomycetales bacterium]|nr:NUDIX hydrolase [Actinomycetales bacterium]